MPKVRAQHVLRQVLHLSEGEYAQAVRRPVDTTLKHEQLEKFEAVPDGLQLPRRLLVHCLDDCQQRGGLFRVEAALGRVRQGVEIQVN